MCDSCLSGSEVGCSSVITSVSVLTPSSGRVPHHKECSCCQRLVADMLSLPYRLLTGSVQISEGGVTHVVINAMLMILFSH